MLFSVIIPLYNKATYVAKAIGSVLSQTFTDYELIIVDDGSKDNSFEIATTAIDGRENCHLIRQENAGVSVARNNGVAASQGDFLCFLDADDWWEPAFLEEMARLIAEFPDAGIYGTNYTIVNETKHKTRVAKVGVDEGLVKGYINYCQAYAKTMYMPLWTGAVCIPRIVFNEMHGFPEGIMLGEDFILWIHIALKYKVAFLNKPLAYYNQDVDTATRGVGKLHKPTEHMLWNLSDLEPLEKSNADFKNLIDILRVEGLLKYFISKKYNREARQILSKVDWTKRLLYEKRKYRTPISWLRLKYSILTIGSKIKTQILSWKKIS